MKKIITILIILLFAIGLVFFCTSGYLRIKYPEYYNLDAFKGIEVYVWQNEDGEYRCGALSGTNRGKTIEELTALAENSATIDEMKSILASYKSEKESINIILVENPHASTEIEINAINPEEIYNLFW